MRLFHFHFQNHRLRVLLVWHVHIFSDHASLKLTCGSCSSAL